MKSVSQLGRVSPDSDALVSAGRKSWNQFKGYDSLSIRYVIRVSGKRQDHRWEKEMSKFLISEVPTLCNLRTGPMKRPNDSSDVPEARLGIWPKTYTSSKRTDKAACYYPVEEWVLPATSTKDPEEREFVVDSGASMHMVSKKEINSAELETMRTSRSPTMEMTPNAEVQTREEATVYVKQLDLFVKVMLLEETPAVHLRSETTSHQKRQEK